MEDADLEDIRALWGGVGWGWGCTEVAGDAATAADADVSSLRNCSVSAYFPEVGVSFPEP